MGTVGNLQLRDQPSRTRCPACHFPILKATAARGTALYLNPTAYPPYSTADLHLSRCRQPAALKRYLAADSHATFTGSKFTPAWSVGP